MEPEEEEYSRESRNCLAKLLSLSTISEYSLNKVDSIAAGPTHDVLGLLEAAYYERYA